MWFVYILLCDNESYYIGLSGNLEKRIASHKTRRNIATKEFTNIKLVYFETYTTRKEAGNREMQLKKWTRAKKKALIASDFDLLKKISKS